MPFPIGGPLEPPNPLSLTVSEIFDVKCNATVGVTLIRLLNKGQGRSFWYQSISHIRIPIALNSNFCFRAHRLATILHVTDDRRQTDRRNTVPIARPLVRSANDPRPILHISPAEMVIVVCLSVCLSRTFRHSILERGIYFSVSVKLLRGPLR